MTTRPKKVRRPRIVCGFPRCGRQTDDPRRDQWCYVRYDKRPALGPNGGMLLWRQEVKRRAAGMPPTTAWWCGTAWWCPNCAKGFVGQAMVIEPPD
jgi:hypothetical protein